MSTFGHDEPDLCACGQKIDHKTPCLLRPGPITTEQLDVLQFGRVLHRRPAK